MKKRQIPKNLIYVMLLVLVLLVLLGIIIFCLYHNKKTIIKKPIVNEDLSIYYNSPDDTANETCKIAEENVPNRMVSDYFEDDIRRMVENIVKSSDMTEQDITELIDRYSNVSIEKLAKELGISEEELRQLIVENREYTDALYIELSKKLDVDVDDIKKMMVQVNNNTWNIKELAERLGTTEKELSQSIIDSRKLSQSEIAAVAEKLKKNTAYLEQLINQNKYLTESGVEDIAKELDMTTSELYALMMQNQAITTEKIDALAKTLSVNSVELKKLIDSNKGLWQESVSSISQKMGIQEDELLEMIAQMRNLTEAEMSELSSELDLSSEELRRLIDGLSQEIADNYSEINEVIVTKEALLKVQNSIQESINAESENREAAVNKAINDLNYAISVSQDEDAKKLQEVKEKLENSLNDGLSDIEGVLNQANEQIDSNINNLTTEIENLNSTVTKINTSISDSNKRISSNEDNINENKTAINGLDSKKAEIYYSITDGVPTLTVDSVIKEGE